MATILVFRKFRVDEQGRKRRRTNPGHDRRHEIGFMPTVLARNVFFLSGTPDYNLEEPGLFSRLFENIGLAET